MTISESSKIHAMNTERTKKISQLILFTG